MNPAYRPTVSVIVVSHNSGLSLIDCVARVLSQDCDCEVLLVDNASADGMLEQIPSDDRLTRLHNVTNQGFAVACNQGAQAARADCLLFLNPDCLLPPGALRRLCDQLAKAPTIGLLGAQLLEADGRPQPASRRASPTLKRLLLPRRSGHLGPLGDTGLERVEAISGALMMMPSSVFHSLNGFDTGYVLHCEDLDLCRRVQQAGWQVAIDPLLQVTHLKGRSSQRRPLWVEWQKHRGMLRYLRKFERSYLGRAVYPLAWVGIWLRYPIAAARAWWSARRARGTLSR